MTRDGLVPTFVHTTGHNLDVAGHQSSSLTLELKHSLFTIFITVAANKAKKMIKANTFQIVEYIDATYL